MKSHDTHDTERIRFHCGCKKWLLAEPSYAGKEITCPSCGRTLLVPILSESDSNTVPDKAWAMIFFLAATIFILMWVPVYFLHTDAADFDQVASAIAVAEAWLGGGPYLPGESVESGLVAALVNLDGPDKAKVESLLAQVRARRTVQYEKHSREVGQAYASTLLDDARRQLDKRNVSKAIELLNKYIKDEHAIAREAGLLLLTEATLAVSEQSALQTLIAMDDAQFDRFVTTKAFDDGRISSAVLIAIRNETFHRMLDTAVRERAHIKEMETQRRHAQQLAEMQRKEKERREKQAAIDAENEKRKQEAQAKAAARANPGTVNLKDLANFPENYAGRLAKMNAVWLLGGLDRHPDKEVFTIGVRTEDGKNIAKPLAFTGQTLGFVTSEKLGRVLDSKLRADTEYPANVYCEIGKIDEKPVARIYRVEILSDSGELLLRVYDEEGEHKEAEEAKIKELANAIKRFAGGTFQNDPEVDHILMQLSLHEISHLGVVMIERVLNDEGVQEDGLAMPTAGRLAIKAAREIVRIKRARSMDDLGADEAEGIARPIMMAN